MADDVCCLPIVFYSLRLASFVAGEQQLELATLLGQRLLQMRCTVYFMLFTVYCICWLNCAKHTQTVACVLTSGEKSRKKAIRSVRASRSLQTRAPTDSLRREHEGTQSAQKLHTRAHRKRTLWLLLRAHCKLLNAAQTVCLSAQLRTLLARHSASEGAKRRPNCMTMRPNLSKTVPN